MQKTRFDLQFEQALKAGQKRDYRKAIAILEDLAARGEADPRPTDAASADDADRTDDGAEAGETGGHPEIWLYLARAWHAEKIFSRAITCARNYTRLCPEDGSGWFFLGRSFLADESPTRAVQALRKSVELNPRSLEARALLGSACLKAKKPTLARAVFEEALNLAPDDERLNQGYLNALFVDAVRTFRRGDAETARQMLTFLINNDIDGVAPRLYLAHALRELGYLPEALSQYMAASEFAPEDKALAWYIVAILLEMGETEEAARQMAALGENEAEGISSEAVALRITRDYLDAGDWAQAAQAARAWLKAGGSNPQAHVLMGEALRNLGKREQSLNHFMRAAELDRKSPAPWYGVLLLLAGERDWDALATMLGKAAQAGCDGETIAYYRALCEANGEGDPADVLAAIQEQVRRHGAVPELILALARTYFRLGLPDLAADWYEKTLDQEPDNEEAWLGHIACCEELERQDDLELAYRDYLDRWADNLAIRKDYFRWLVSREKWEGAADQLELLSATGRSDSLNRSLALYRRRAGQFRAAAILYRDLLRKKPEDRGLLANLVFCLDRMGERESALALIHKANRVFAPSAETLLIEARLLRKSGDDDGALAAYRAVVDAFPNDPRGWTAVADLYAERGVPEMASMYAQKARDIAEAAKKSRAARVNPAKKGTRKSGL